MAVNIYLSVNSTYQTIKKSGGTYSNSDSFIVLPVIPAKIEVSKPQNVQEFETVTLQQLAFIAPAKLKTISWSSFFPCRDYPYVRGERLPASQYVYIIDNWIAQKIPIRLVITGLAGEGGENVFMAAAVSDFSYEVGTDGDLHYEITFKNYPLTEVAEENGGELMSAEYDELKRLQEQTNQKIEDLATGYGSLDNIPIWAREAVEYFYNHGFLRGEEVQTANVDTGEIIVKATDHLNLTEQTLKSLVILYRVLKSKGLL